MFFSCKNSGKDLLREESLIGKKINLMQYAVTPYNTDIAIFKQNIKTPFKIITYANLYCEPCWQSACQWKIHFDDFKQYPQVVLLFYVLGSKDDFDLKNKDAKLKFPVLLDNNERFSKVNKLGNNPERLTFLLNEKNEVILVGQPFSPELKRKYIKAIQQTNK